MRKVLLIFTACAVAAATAAATGHDVYVFVGNEIGVHPWLGYESSMRCQLLFDRDKIDYAGTITEFELEKPAAVATFYDVKFYLCHAPLAALTTDFAANYGGNTPKLVASFATYELPAVEGVYPIPMAETFDYNNQDNLILEITWTSASSRRVHLFAGTLTAHQCYAYDAEATTGTVENMGYNAGVVFNTYPGVAPASLGRVKALYR